MKGSSEAKWDAYFEMDKSVSFSDVEGESSHNESSVSNSDRSEKPKRRWQKFYKYTDSESCGYRVRSESDSESEDYDSDIENRQRGRKKLPFRLRRNKRYSSDEPYSDVDDDSLTDENSHNECDDKSNNDQSVFSSYANKINIKNDRRELTLIPIGGATQAQYMVLTPKSDFDNNAQRILSPHSIRSVSLKKGISNNTTTTKKKIFKVRTKKNPEKKQFLKVHPKKLEEKYEKMKTKTSRTKNEEHMNIMDNPPIHEIDRNDIENHHNLKDTIPLFATLSRIAIGSQQEPSEIDDDENETELEDETVDAIQKKTNPLNFLRSLSNIRSNSGNDKDKFSDLDSFQSQEFEEKKSVRSFWKNRSRSFSKSDNNVEKKLQSNDSTQAQDDLVGIEIAKPMTRSKRGFSFRKLLKFGKMKGIVKKDSIDSKQSDSSIKQTQLRPNKVFSMVRSPKKSTEFALLKEDDTIQNEMVVFYYFGGEPKNSMDHIKKKEELIPAKDSEEVLVQVEASTVSKTDCDIRNELLWTKSGKNILPMIPGVDFVGKVVRCGEMATINYGINVDDRVASLIQTGGNCKYLVEHANQLVRVPKQLKADEATVMVEIYLSSFQMLLIGKTGEDRYKSRPLNGKEILILGGISTMNQAMIELAVFLGAKNVYTTSLPKHYAFLQELGATTLDIRPECWLKIVQGKMDLAVDSLCDDLYDSPWKALNSNGKLICNGMQTIMNEGPGCINSLEQFWARTKSACMPRTHYYDVYSHWENNLEESKEDLAFLFRLLERNALHPSIADTLPLRKVAKAHTFLNASRRIQGSFVCLPHSEG